MPKTGRERKQKRRMNENMNALVASVFKKSIKDHGDFVRSCWPSRRVRKLRRAMKSDHGSDGSAIVFNGWKKGL